MLQALQPYRAFLKRAFFSILKLLMTLRLGKLNRDRCVRCHRGRLSQTRQQLLILLGNSLASQHQAFFVVADKFSLCYLQRRFVQTSSGLST